MGGLKEFVDKAKIYIFLGGLLTIVIGGVVWQLSYAEIPQKVDKLKVDHLETKEHVKKLANTFDKYMAVQHTRQEAQDKREAMMFELIKENRDN